MATVPLLENSLAHPPVSVNAAITAYAAALLWPKPVSHRPAVPLSSQKLPGFHVIAAPRTGHGLHPAPCGF